MIQRDAPYAGELFIQGAVGGIAFDDVHGNGWRLITIDDGLDLADRTWFESLGGKIVALRELDVELARWFDDHDAISVLVRPDFRIYGTAASSADAASLLHSLRHQLDHTRTGAPT